ncbi:acetate kinase [Aneurinibacillus sp. REN35]|uniref:acetate kinase n=1 Tax=Aneurinibacillus sp. REN35 TaxID=3237286 RepID=UPI0035298134
MSIILSVNSGSSSFKYQLIDMPAERVIAKGMMERIGSGESLHTFDTGGEKIAEVCAIADHEQAVTVLMQTLVHPAHGILTGIDEIKGIGHRVVHGGEVFTDSVLIDDNVLAQLTACIELAPLHNPANLIGIRAFKKALPHVPAVAVFDTAFHQTMPQKTYLYSIPYSYYKDFGVRKYGFHGTSHKYVTTRAAELMQRPLEQLRIISCHLGNGASIAAVRGGKSIDTSMGFTPLAGLTMGTRAGDVDAALIPYLMEKTGKSATDIVAIFNKESGIHGISGLSSDLRDIEVAISHGDDRAKLALDIFIERVRKYIGSYAAQMNGVDAIVFTAGIGENSAMIRAAIVDKLEWMGVYFDHEKNNVRSREAELTHAHSPVKVWIVPTNEEVMIARDTMKAANIKEETLV